MNNARFEEGAGPFDVRGEERWRGRSRKPLQRLAGEGALSLLQGDHADVQERLELPRVQLQRALPGLERLARAARALPGRRRVRSRPAEGARSTRTPGRTRRAPPAGDWRGRASTRCSARRPRSSDRSAAPARRLRSPSPPRRRPPARSRSRSRRRDWPIRAEARAPRAPGAAARTVRRGVPAGSRAVRPENRAAAPPRERRWRGRPSRPDPRDRRGTRRGPASWAGPSSPPGPGRAPPGASPADREPTISCIWRSRSINFFGSSPGP